MQTTSPPAEQVVLLSVDWDGYTTIIGLLGDRSAQRVAYDGETLEIMSPSNPHEEYIRLLDGLLRLYALAKGMELQNIGSTTLRSEFRGAEPDSAYYIADAPKMIGRRTLDLSIDPAPEIAIEVDISRARLRKDVIYASLGIREFWRYDGTVLRAQELAAHGYVEVAVSGALDGLSIAEINRFMEMRHELSQSAISKLWFESLAGR